MEISSSEVPTRKKCKLSAKLFRIILFFIVVLTFIVVFSFVWYVADNSRELLVQTKSGAIRGHYLTSYKGNQYEAYQGIPYAEPPIGRRRFESPSPIEPWSDELQTTKMKPRCLQDILHQPNAPLTGSEDCLYLNVYTPSRKITNKRLPVIFYIHGGDFRYGGNSEAEEKYIIEYDVIFITSQYRLGVLGFLSTEDKVVPGNMGLKDQSTALRWVYDNIEAFGGDPKRITLIGSSAGGAAALLHSLSPWSRGLFRAGMSLSGSPFAGQCIKENPRHKAFTIARQINCTEKETGRMIKCMKDVPAEVLVGAQHRLQTWWNLNYGVSGPVVENISWSVDPFIDDYPSRILKEGRGYDVPWTMGSVSEEGLAYTAVYSNDSLKYIDEHWDSLAPSILEYNETLPKEQHVSIARRIRKHYLNDKPIDRENFRAFTHLIGDRLFGVATINAVKEQAAVKKSPVRLYYYSYRATESISNQYTNSTTNFGVCHGDDIRLIVKAPKLDPKKSNKDMIMQKLLIKMWTSVTYNTVPDIGIEWLNVNLKNKTCLDYLHIAGPDDYKMKCSDNLADNNFWNSIGFHEK